MSLAEIEKEIVEASDRLRTLKDKDGAARKLAEIRRKLDDAELFERATSAAFTTPEVIKSGIRDRDIVDKRHIVFLLLRQTGLSFPRVGEICGDFDHGTVIHGIKRIEQLATVYPETQRQIELARQRFAKGKPV